MRDREKEKWDEIIGGIDEKFTAEAAEMLRRCSENEYDRSENGVEIKIAEKRRRKPFAVWCASAAAVVVVGAAGALFMSNSAGRIDTSDQVCDDASSSGVMLCKANTYDGSSRLMGVYSYNIDFDVFEEYFVGRWYSQNAGEERGFSYIGSSRDLGFCSGLYSVYKNDEGCYLMNKTADGTQMYFIPSGDASRMYLYNDVSSIVDRNEYNDVLELVDRGTDDDRKITVGNYLSGAALCRLDMELNGAVTTIFGDISGTVFNDNEGGQWYVSAPTDEGYAAPLLVSRDGGNITLGVMFGNVSTSEPRVIYIRTMMNKNGSWGWNATDADGRSYFIGDDNVIYSEDTEIYRQWFMGEWENAADPSEKFTLSYTEDIFEKGQSRYIGYGSHDDLEKGSSFYLSVKSEKESDTGVVPYFGGETVRYVVYCDEPDLMYCVAAGSDEPYAIYIKTGTVSAELPERGWVSQLGMYSIVTEYGGNLPLLFSNIEQQTECDGKLCVNGGAPYYLLGKEDGTLTVMMDYTVQETGEDISVVTTFVLKDNEWKAAFSENAVEMSENGIRTEMTEDGCYYLAAEQTNIGELLRVFFYRPNDGIMYELNADGRDGFRLYDAMFTSDGNTLYVLGKADGEVRLAEYSDGQRGGVICLSEIETEFCDLSLELSDRFIYAGWKDGEYKTAEIGTDQLNP